MRLKVFKQLPEGFKELRFSPYQQEAYLEAFLLENFESLFAIEEDDEIFLLGRQIDFPTRKNRIDILLLKNSGNNLEIVIVEVKTVAEKNSLNQICGYLERWEKEGKKVLEQFKKEIEKQGFNNKDIKKIKGFLVAHEFKGIKEKDLEERAIQGIKVGRYSDNEGNVYFFLNYLPVVKSKKAKIEVGKAEFWKNTNKEKKRQVEEILESLSEEDPDITWKYYKSMISIFGSQVDAERHPHRRLAKYQKGDKCIRVKDEENKYPKIPLSEKEKIIKEIINAKKRLKNIFI